MPTASVTPAEPAAAEPVPTGAPVRKTLVFTTTQPARIEAFENAPLYANVSGYVSEVLVDIGDRVQKDQPLVRIAVPELADERRQKQALVAHAQAQIGQALASQKAADAALASSKASVEQAQAGVSRTEADYQRWEAESTRIDALALNGSVTQKVADETRNQLRSADAARRETAATIRTAEALVAEAQAGLEKAKADVVAAQARQTVAESELARVDTMLRYTELKAPFDGVVTSRAVDQGHLVRQGETVKPLISITRSDRVRVFFDVPEVEAAMVNVGDAAAIRVQALDGLEVAGEVTRTAWSLDEQNRSLKTEVDLDNESDQLRPGMYAIATVRLAERRDVLTLPVPAVSVQPEGAFCFVIRDKKATRTPITLGLRVGNEWEIAEGLHGDEDVALAKADLLQNGQLVTATP